MNLHTIPPLYVDANLRWNAARIPVQLRGHVIEDLALPFGACDAARDFIESFPQRYLPENTPLAAYPEDRSLVGRGLTLTGHPHAGKTSLGCAVLTEIALGRADVTVLFVPFGDYMHSFNERHTWRREARSANYEENIAQLDGTLTRVMDSSLVLLDDIGREHTTASGAAADELYRVVRSRHRRGLVTILTTSLSPQALQEAYSAHMADFLLREFTTVMVSAPGHRA